MGVPTDSLYITTVFFLRFLWDIIYTDWSKASMDQGLTVTEEQVLWAIWLLDSSTVTEVASHLQRDKGTISKCIYSLEENGLIVREAGVDRRSYEFRITPEGDELRGELDTLKGHRSTFFRAFNKLTETEQRTFLDIALTLATHIEGEAYVSEMVRYLGQMGKKDASRSSET